MTRKKQNNNANLGLEDKHSISSVFCSDWIFTGLLQEASLPKAN